MRVLSVPFSLWERGAGRANCSVTRSQPALGSGITPGNSGAPKEVKKYPGGFSDDYFGKRGKWKHTKVLKIIRGSGPETGTNTG